MTRKTSHNFRSKDNIIGIFKDQESRMLHQHSIKMTLDGYFDSNVEQAM